MRDMILRSYRAILKAVVMFCIGGSIYYLIEVVFRAVRNHQPPMPHVFFLGGGALIIGLLLTKIPFSLKRKFIFLPIIGFFVLTAYEYVFGWYFVTFENLRIWDYTGCPLEYKGLICFKFSLCWGALIWLIIGIDMLTEKILGKTKFSDKNLFRKKEPNR